MRGKIRETVDVVDRTIEGIRRIIGKLSPLVLQELGLVAAIRKEAKDFARNAGVKARVLISDDVGRLASGTEQAIYRVVQEALHNVAKHAQAKNVTVQVMRADDVGARDGGRRWRWNSGAQAEFARPVVWAGRNQGTNCHVGRGLTRDLGQRKGNAH